MYEDYFFREDRGKILLERRDKFQTDVVRSRKNPQSFTERIILIIFGILFFIFATHYLEIMAPPDSLSAYHWMWQ
jgi:hypothetical protein